MEGLDTEGRSCNDDPCPISGQGAYGGQDEGFRENGQSTGLPNYIGYYDPKGPATPGRQIILTNFLTNYPRS